MGVADDCSKDRTALTCAFGVSNISGSVQREFPEPSREEQPAAQLPLGDFFLGAGNVAVGQNQWYHFGVGAPPVYFSGMFTGG